MHCDKCPIRNISCDPELCANALLAGAHCLPDGRENESDLYQQTLFEESHEPLFLPIPRQIPWRTNLVFSAG